MSASVHELCEKSMIMWSQSLKVDSAEWNSTAVPQVFLVTQRYHKQRFRCE